MNKLLWYPRNLKVGAANLLRAIVGKYRPNGDGYIHSCLYALDCFGNAIAFGDPLETISSRSGKARNEGKAWGCVMCAFLGYIASVINGKPTDHCADSILKNEGARAIIPD